MTVIVWSDEARIAVDGVDALTFSEEVVGGTLDWGRYHVHHVYHQLTPSLNQTSIDIIREATA